MFTFVNSGHDMAWWQVDAYLEDVAPGRQYMPDLMVQGIGEPFDLSAQHDLVHKYFGDRVALLKDTASCGDGLSTYSSCTLIDFSHTTNVDAALFAKYHWYTSAIPKSLG
jgi:hypothetical protein